jgi:hypothetical protein
MVNNVIYGWGGSNWNTTNPSDSVSQTNGQQVDIIGNVYLPGPHSYANAYALYSQGTPSGSRFYLNDNIAPRLTNVGSSNISSSRLMPGAQVRWSAAETFDLVLAGVGTRPWDRDPVDVRVIEGVRAANLPLRDKVGTWPSIKVNTRAVVVNNPVLSASELDRALLAFETNGAAPAPTEKPTTAVPGGSASKPAAPAGPTPDASGPVSQQPAGPTAGAPLPGPTTTVDEREPNPTQVTPPTRTKAPRKTLRRQVRICWRARALGVEIRRGTRAAAACRVVRARRARRG